MRRSHRRLLALFVSLPVAVLLLALLYQFGMEHLEERPRSLVSSIEFVSETITSTGYGRDNHWAHPAMTSFAILLQFVGVFMIFLVFPLFLIPFIEERFEGRLANQLPNLKGHVLIYGYGPAVESLIDQLDHEKVPVVIMEEDEAVARRLRDRGRRVIHARLEEDDPDLTPIKAARGVVVNGLDHNNAVMTLSARQCGFEGPIVAMVDNPNRRNPIMRAGATAAFTPIHILAAAISAKASAKINPRVAGVQPLGDALEVAELRVHRDSTFAGKTLAECGIRAKTGATIIGQWVEGELVAQPAANSPINSGSILVAAGGVESIKRLAEIAKPITRSGPLIIAGYSSVGEKVAEFLRGAGEEIRVVAWEERDGVDVIGDPLDPASLRKAGVTDAQAVILALESDSATLFTAALVRDLAPEVVILASVKRAENVGRIHRAGADFVLSISQVSAQMLSFHILGEESVELQPQLKLVKVRAAGLAGKNPITSRVRERTGCSVVAVERKNEIIVDFDHDFEFDTDDTVYIAGSPHMVTEFFEVFPSVRQVVPAH